MKSGVIYSLVGLPGTGKSSFVQLCNKSLAFEYIPVGDLVKEQVTLNTDLGILVKTSLINNKLIPDDKISDFVNNLIIKKLNNNLNKDLIIDGYPKTVGQGIIFLKFLKDFLSHYNFKIIYFILENRDILTERLINRFMSKENISNNNYKHKEIVKNIEIRLNKHEIYIYRMLNFYTENGQEILKLHVNNKTQEDILTNFKRLLK